MANAVSSLGTLVPPTQPRWPIALQMALTLAIPLAIGTAAGRIDLGMLASVGAFTVPYFAALPRLERLRLRPVAALAIIGSAALGAVLGSHRFWATLGLVVVTVVASIGVEAFRLGPPGPLFPVLVYGLSANAVAHGVVGTTLVVCVTAGCALAIVISVAPLVRKVHWKVTPRSTRELLTPDPWDRGRVELVARNVVVAIAGTVAAVVTVDPERAYWVVASGVVVVGFVPSRGPALQRGLHRTLGTFAGAAAYLALAAIHPGDWAIVALMFALQYGAEIVITRNYALAVVMLTPLALMLATVASGQFGSVEIARERIVDTLVGATIGVLTAFIHRPDVVRRAAVAR
jgi:hypothetical protein